jgi:hypothetical protein
MGESGKAKRFQWVACVLYRTRACGRHSDVVACRCSAYPRSHAATSPHTSGSVRGGAQGAVAGDSSPGTGERTFEPSGGPCAASYARDGGGS